MAVISPARFAVYTVSLLFLVHFLYLFLSGSLPYGSGTFRWIEANHTNLHSHLPQQSKGYDVSFPVVVAVPSAPLAAPFPRKIWQTSKMSPGSISGEDREAINTWTKINPKYRYEAMTAYSAESYVRTRFASQPELVEVFVDLQDPILRADLIRYLVLLGDGGVYSDIDTRALKPIDEWIPAGLAGNVSIVVGIEYDVLGGGRWGDWTLDLQFCTWAIMARPQHDLLQRTADRVLRGLRRLAHKQGVPIAGIKASFADVLDTTGPGLFTEAVFEYLTAKVGEPYTWKNVTGLKREILVEDVLILPITAFGSGQAHSGSGRPEDDGAYVQHMFKGSWKGDHPLVLPTHDDHGKAAKEEAAKEEAAKEEAAKEEAAKEEAAKEEAAKEAVAEEEAEKQETELAEQEMTKKQDAEAESQEENKGQDEEKSRRYEQKEQRKEAHHVRDQVHNEPQKRQMTPAMAARDEKSEKGMLTSLQRSRIWRRQLVEER